MKKIKDWRKAPTKAILDSILGRFGVCAKCGYSLNGHYTIDYEIPLEDGGTTELHNFRPLCSDCQNIVLEYDEKHSIEYDEKEKTRREERGQSFKKTRTFFEKGPKGRWK